MSSKTQLMSFGLLWIMYALELSSFGGLTFSVAEESIDKILMQTLLVLSAGVQSESRVLRQMYPQEYMCSCIGGVPLNITSGDSNGY